MCVPIVTGGITLPAEVTLASGWESGTVAISSCPNRPAGHDRRRPSRAGQTAAVGRAGVPPVRLRVRSAVTFVLDAQRSEQYRPQWPAPASTKTRPQDR